ncbi:Prephenate dehydrogenase [Planctomyces bekefii]|uniref:Prephenate dehydrogenase n=1 Tax=Planctomyces bekefii TaxID=1653850 RepID=A0A5C6M456_9PLAN|nr:Prephenate dehydrogenase [Planctomyces bekefii]
MQTERTLVIVGVGLIGGSVAAAARKAMPELRIVGIGRSPQRLQAAVDQGLLDAWHLQAAVGQWSDDAFGLVCLPVDQITAAAKQLLQAGCSTVTDAGSVKEPICSLLQNEARFVGSHPIAGSEQSGFEHACADLFRQRVCVVCGDPNQSPSTARTAAFWRQLGMVVRFMNPAEHDRVLARTSHLPHMLASVAAACVSDSELEFTGTGFRDTTRIAAGSAEIWSSILLQNRAGCLNAIAAAGDLLDQFRQAIETGNSQRLTEIWNTAATRRRRLDQTQT